MTHSDIRRAKKPGFKFSFIMPVYNVEKYLDETIQSVLTQTMDFRENCQLVLINDGSPDNSEEICLTYKEQYPDNIIYIKQKNQGVSVARNRGLDVATGKYINFLDSDDKLSSDTLEKVYDFMEENFTKTDLCAIKMEFFDAKTGPHVLNWKFKQTQVVDLEKEPEYVQLSSSSAFIKNDVIKTGKHCFDARVTHSEDSKFISEIILKKLKIGILSEPTYYYRRRRGNDSAINGSYTNKNWYLITPKLVYKYLFQYSKEMYGHIPKYIQHLVMYDLQWRFLQEKQAILKPSEEKEYRKSLFKLVQEIDTSIILYQKHIYIQHKLYILKTKFNLKDFKELKKRGGSYYIDNNELYSYDKFKQDYVLAAVDVGEHNVLLEGVVRGHIFFDVKFGFLIGEKFIEAERIPYGQNSTFFLGEKIYEANNFKANIPVRPGQMVVPTLLFKDGTTKPLKITPGRHSKLPPYTGRSYFVSKFFITVHLNPTSLLFLQASPRVRLKKEIRFLQSTIMNKSLNKKVRASVVLLRIYYFAVKPLIRRKIWLISDRPQAANDNGEAFFKYVSKQKNRYLKPYFVISRKTNDFSRVKKYGPVVGVSGIKYKLLFLLSDKVISSAADDFVTNPYGDEIIHWIQDILDFEFVFLQHGVIHNNLSGWLNKFRKNIGTFVVTSGREYDAITGGEYGYFKKQVILSGQPRYDYLQDKSSGNRIIIMPTWRHALAGTLNEKSLNRKKNDLFKKSEYFKQWQGVIQDRNLNKLLKDHSVKVDFYLHPALHANIDDFKGTEMVTIKTPPFDYAGAFNEGSLLITDYSSVAFDFAYLRKPVIYFQFDKQDFFANHLFEEGYFRYEKDSFGPIVNDIEDLAAIIQAHIKNQFNITSNYKKKIESFYKWNDNLNSLRLYTHLIQKDIKEFISLSVIMHKKKNSAENKELKAYWWRYVYPMMLNFGDEITPYIAKSLWGCDANWADINEAELIGPGSILEMAGRRKNNNKIHVWGSGFMKEAAEIPKNTNFVYHAVRGQLSRERIGGTKIALGDPGLLASMIFAKSKAKKYKIGIVFHYADRGLPIFSEVKGGRDALLIDPLQTPDKVARDITSCEIIFSSSLHGLIFADSFKVPNYWMPFSDNVAGGDYKFRDYYSSTNRELIKVKPSTLNDNEEINRLMKRYKKVPNLKKIQKDLIQSFPFPNGVEVREPENS